MEDPNTWSWYGTLTTNNIEQVTQCLREVLTGKSYTWVGTHEMRDKPEIRQHQQLDKVKAAMHSDSYGSIGIYDTYGAYTVPIADTTFIHFEYDKKVEIEEITGSGHRITWTFAVE